MPVEEVLVELESVFKALFKNPHLRLTVHTTASDIPQWDSLAHINLILALEKKFKVRFALGELESMRNVRAMIDAIIRKSE